MSADSVACRPQFDFCTVLWVCVSAREQASNRHQAQHSFQAMYLWLYGLCGISLLESNSTKKHWKKPFGTIYIMRVEKLNIMTPCIVMFRSLTRTLCILFGCFFFFFSSFHNNNRYLLGWTKEKSFLLHNVICVVCVYMVFRWNMD